MMMMMMMMVIVPTTTLLLLLLKPTLLQLPSGVAAHDGGGMQHHQDGPMARHLLLQQDDNDPLSGNSSSMVVVLVTDGATTAGPFDEEESDYVNDPDLTLAARADSAIADNDVTVDRASVLDGIPLNLTVRVYGLANRRTTTVPQSAVYPNVQVSIWHCDAAGVYSAAESEGTEGQKWLRGRQVTDVNGTATFRTILPGLYPGRMAHYHIRLRLPGETSSYAAISQLYLADADVDRYRTISPYDTAAGAVDGAVTYSTTDGVYSGVDPVVARRLTLILNGDVTKAVSSEISLGLLMDDDDTDVVAPPSASPLPVALSPGMVTASSPVVTAPSPNNEAVSGGGTVTSSSSPAVAPQPTFVVHIIMTMMTTLLLLLGSAVLSALLW